MPLEPSIGIGNQIGCILIIIKGTIGSTIGVLVSINLISVSSSDVVLGS